MNTKVKLFFILFTFICVGIVSCNDEEKTDYAKEIAGNYKGVITTSEGDIPLANDVVVNVVYESENKVILKMNQNIGELLIDIACKSDVKYNDNKYNVAGNTSFNFTMDGLPVPIPLPVSVSGEIDNKKSATLNISVALPPESSVQIPGLPISVVFSGTKQ